MPLAVGGQDYSIYQGQIAYALKQYARIHDTAALSNETIGCIIGYLRTGPGSPPVPYHDLVTTLQGSYPAGFAAVANNPIYWDTEARQVYRRWMDVHAQIVKKLATVMAQVNHIVVLEEV